MNKIIIALFFASLVLISCTPQQDIQQEQKIDLCNEINIPSATVNCEKAGDTTNCYLSISGDSRVRYFVDEYGVWGVVGPNAPVNAGEGVQLSSNTQERVEVTPFIPTDSPYFKNPNRCYNKKIIIYRGQFSGTIPDLAPGPRG